jgi:hypothetical protein
LTIHTTTFHLECTYIQNIIQNINIITQTFLLSPNIQHLIMHISHWYHIKSWNLTRKYRCDSPICNRSSTCAPLLLMLHHAYGPSCKSQVYLIKFPHSRICFIITISTTNKSFFQSFLNILCFSSLHLLILSFFVQP